MKILKFGGSSVGTPDRILQIISIIKKELLSSEAGAVVVSAFSGVTDALIAIGQKASAGDSSYKDLIDQLHHRHAEAIQKLIPKETQQEVLNEITERIKELTDHVQGVFLVRELSARTQDLLMSFGERLSAFIISRAIGQEAVFVDTRSLIRTDKQFGHALVDFEATNSRVQRFFSELKGKLPIVTGFIAGTEEGETTTLGRGGSDYTASILGAALEVEEIQIWTDVDGVMTADPRKVQEAFPIPVMTFQEALEMSHFGAKVIHPPTIAPAMHQGIPIRIKNSFHPDAEGTLIVQTLTNHQAIICGISSIDRIALLRLEGSGMVGVCGIAMRLFAVLAKQRINVILITQASSEHSICLAVTPEQADLAKQLIDQEFDLERRAELVEETVVEKDLCILAVVGENMRFTPGVAGRLFDSLGRSGINVIAIAQGSSEYNISVVIKRTDEVKALNVIHEAFFLSPLVVYNVFLVGVGLIGKTLLKQIIDELPNLREKRGIDLKLVGLANSKKMVFDAQGISLEGWKEKLNQSVEEMEENRFIERMKDMNVFHPIFVDCTASDEIAKAYPEILEKNIAVVTPNKRANSESYATYCRLKKLSKQRGVRFLYETNVAAGLPILSTINDLRASGDTILKIEAVLSGTLSFVFNLFATGVPFSQAVKRAQELGYTEPDPREDLKGLDVKRKLLILARESGYALEPSEIEMESLFPDEVYLAANTEQFYELLKGYDQEWEERREKAVAEDKKYQYIALFEEGRAQILLKLIGKDHPFYGLSGNDNILAITTQRYREGSPMVIRGPGAGAEVTAGAVFADIVRIAK